MQIWSSDKQLENLHHFKFSYLSLSKTCLLTTEKGNRQNDLMKTRAKGPQTDCSPEKAH